MKSEDLKMTWCSLAASNGLEESYWSNDEREEENNIEWKKITNKITEEKTPTTTTAIWQENVRLLCVHTCAWMLLWFFFVGFCSCLVVMIAVAVSPRFVFTLLGFFSLCSHFSVRCWLENSLGWKSCFVVSVFFPFLTSSLLYSILLFSFLSSCSILLKLDGFFFSFIRISKWTRVRSLRFNVSSCQLIESTSLFPFCFVGSSWFEYLLHPFVIHCWSDEFFFRYVKMSILYTNFKYQNSNHTRHNHITIILPSSSSVWCPRVRIHLRSRFQSLSFLSHSLWMFSFWSVILAGSSMSHPTTLDTYSTDCTRILSKLLIHNWLHLLNLDKNVFFTLFFPLISLIVSSLKPILENRLFFFTIIPYLSIKSINQRI